MKPTIDRNIDVTPKAYDCLHSLASELGKTREDVASVILYHYCSSEAYRRSSPGTTAHTSTDTLARQIRITPAAYERLHSLASEPHLSALILRDVASVILCHYCSKEYFETAQGG